MMLKLEGIMSNPWDASRGDLAWARQLEAEPVNIEVHP